MTCIAPPELDDWQLLAYWDGGAKAEVAQHLEHCDHCRTKAERMAQSHSRLTAQLFRATCPPSIELGEYHLGLLDREHAAITGQHLKECPHCAREVAQLRSYLAENAPTIEFSWRERAQVLIAHWVDAAQGDEGSAQQPARAPAFAGLRGEARGPLTLEANGIVIVLDIQPAAEGRVTILGQIAADDQDRWTGAVVELRQADATQATTTVDDLGAFRCEAFPLGPTEILITPSSGSSVLIPNVEIVV